MKMKMKHAAQAAVVMLAAAALAAVLLACPPGEDEEGTGTGNPTGTTPSITGSGSGTAPQWQVSDITVNGRGSAPKGGYAGFYSVATFTGPETNAKKAVTWKIKDGATAMATAGGSTLKANGRGALLTINPAETAETITVVATSTYTGSTNVFGECTIEILASAPPNPDAGIMEMEIMGSGFAGPNTEVIKYRIQSNWDEKISGQNFFVDDKGKLALGEGDPNLPYSGWYLMRNINDHTKRGIKNIGTGNYINIKGITRFVGTHGSNILLADYTPEEQAALMASQPNVSPFEDDPAFYWVFRPINQSAGLNPDGTTFTAEQDGVIGGLSIVATNFINYPYAKDEVTAEHGGAISHEWAGRTPLRSQNSSWLYHVEWRYDEGTMEDTVDNIPWRYRLGDWAMPEGGPNAYYKGSWDPPPTNESYYVLKGWGGYNFGVYDHWW